MKPTSRTFPVTGVSTGFGRAFATAALDDGYRVVGGVRNQRAVERLTALCSDRRAHGEVLDATDDGFLAAAVQRTEQTVGAIGVLIANPGYGSLAVEVDAELEAGDSVNASTDRPEAT